MQQQDSVIECVLVACDIVDVVGQRINVHKKGSGFVALCPFHQDSKPSLHLVPAKQIYKCFACGAGGNAINFVKEYEKVSFKEALRILADRYSITLPEWQPEDTAQIAARTDHRTLLFATLTKAHNYYQTCYANNKIALQYAETRGITPALAATFQVGYAPNTNNELRTLATTNLLTEVGLWNQEKNKARFSHRLLFPIRTTEGKCVGFGGRALNDTQIPKYLNSPETLLFQKQRILFGMFEALQNNRNPKQLVVVEGYMDVIALHSCGITHVVATMGTALGAAHFEQLFRYTNHVILCFDGDQAGRKATERAVSIAMSKINQQKRLSVCLLPIEQDPDTLAQQGADMHSLVYDNSLPLSHYLFHHRINADANSTPETKAQALAILNPLISNIEDSSLRTLFVKAFSEHLDMSLAVWRHNQHSGQSSKRQIIVVPNTTEPESVTRAENTRPMQIQRRHITQRPPVLLDTLYSVCCLLFNQPTLRDCITDAERQQISCGTTACHIFLQQLFALRQPVETPFNRLFVAGALQSIPKMQQFCQKLIQNSQPIDGCTEEQLQKLVQHLLHKKPTEITKINSRLKQQHQKQQGSQNSTAV